MPIIPIITFKAGRCDLNTASKPYKVRAIPEKGYIYLYSEDDLLHFCWRPRSQPIDDEVPVDLMMVPGDGRFVPYEYTTTDQPSSKTNGRIFVLKFSSSSQRYLFWLQSKPQGPEAHLSPRDRKIGDIVDRLLQGDEVDIGNELEAVRNNPSGGGGGRGNDGDGDETMEDGDGHGDSQARPQGGTGGAGPDATGGDVRREGEDSREGGADGARAASGGGAIPDAATAVQNFLNSLKGGPGALSGGRAQGDNSSGKFYPPLNDLLDPSTTLPVLEALDEDSVDEMLPFLPESIIYDAAAEAVGLDEEAEGGDAARNVFPTVEDAACALSLDRRRALVARVLRSPQLQQSLASTTAALRDGGLPGVAEALGVPVENGGRVHGGNVPLGGGEAVEAFVEGVKKMVVNEPKTRGR